MKAISYKNTFVRKIGIIVLISCLLIHVITCAEEAPQLDLSNSSYSDLKAFKSEIDNVLDLYHETDSSLESDLLSLVKTAVTSHFDGLGIDISWAWFDYSYTKDGDFCTVSTHIDYRDENHKTQKPNVYAELFPVGEEYEIFYLTVGYDTLIDRRSELPNSIWKTEPEPIISEITGINLAVYSTDALENLRSQINNEISANHEPKSAVSDVVKSLTKSATEKYLSEKDATVSWPWFDYNFTNDWNLYTLTIPVTVKNSAGRSDMDVYSEAYPINGQYALVYLVVGNDIVLDNRNLIGTSNSSSQESNSEVEINTEAAIDNDDTTVQSNETTNEPIIMQKGSKGADVKALQENLIMLGYLSGSADGDFGNKTQDAVIRFQRAYNLTEDGCVTQSLLDLVTQAVAYIPPKPQTYTAVALYNKFDQNEIAATEELKGTTIEVTGKICSIDSSIWGDYYVKLYADSWGLSGVYCYFDDDAKPDIASLRKESNVSIQGVCNGAGVLGDPELTHCNIIK